MYYILQLKPRQLSSEVKVAMTRAGLRAVDVLISNLTVEISHPIEEDITLLSLLDLQVRETIINCTSLSFLPRVVIHDVLHTSDKSRIMFPFEKESKFYRNFIHVKGVADYW